MDTWGPQDWVVFFGAAATFLGTLATVVLQVIGNLRTAQAKAISTDSNEKVTAVVAQTREIARATPDASTAPTDAVATKPTAAEATRNNGA